jgi:hypothetical protein
MKKLMMPLPDQDHLPRVDLHHRASSSASTSDKQMNSSSFPALNTM